MINNDMDQNQLQSKRVETSYHEAGHAVIASAVGLKVDEVSITPLDCSFGRCVVAEVSVVENIHRLLQAAYDFAAFLVAGRLAQEKYLDSIGAKLNVAALDHDCSDDYNEIIAINTRIRNNGDEYKVCLSKVSARVQNLLASPEMWELIQQISDALLIENKMNSERITSFLTPVYKRYYQP